MREVQECNWTGEENAKQGKGNENVITGVDSADAEQGPVGDGGEVVGGHGRDRARVEVPVVQHQRWQLRQVPPVALVAVQPRIVLAPSRPLHPCIKYLCRTLSPAIPGK